MHSIMHHTPAVRYAHARATPVIFYIHMKNAPAIAQETKYWHLSAQETAQLLETDIEKGLNTEDAAKRLAVFGRNAFESSEKTGWIKILLNQIRSPLILILIVAGAVMLAISHYRDAAFIFIAVAVNSALGFWQEHKAERALAALQTYLKQRTRVIRDGEEKELDAEEVVPGDIIRLAQGDRVPADARIFYANDFQTDESVLTGESLPVEKTASPAPETATIADQLSMVFAGTLVTQGICTAIACRTDAHAELGKIASSIASAVTEKTPLQKSISKFSIYLSILLGALTLGVFGIGIASGKPVLEMFLTAVAIAVSAIPEGLPISMTVTLAIGVERMARRKGVVRKLIAAEALGSTTVILTDKTGTLTMAKMTLAQIIPFAANESTVMRHALANAAVLVENPNDHPDAWRMSGRIMETALARAAVLRGIPLRSITDKTDIEQAIPFNAVQKFSASLLRENRSHAVAFFGAPDILLARSSLSKEKKREIAERIDTLASSGERVLGVASKKIRYTKSFSLKKDLPAERLSFEGLITFRDPVRQGIHRAIERVREAGVRTIIMTGDHRGTALAVAKEIGMPVGEHAVLDASELQALSDEDLLKRLPDLRVIARVTPLDKMRVAALLQKSGEIVAMTGDGVNDAPSIKQANVGIAMGSGTQVAQSVADLILLDDNFETIVAAIEEGRRILGNIRKVLVYLLSNVSDGLLLIGGSIVAGIPLPLNALQILWVNFFSDSLPAIGFAFEEDPDSLAQRPVKKGAGLFDPLTKFLIITIGISTSILLFATYFALLKLGYGQQLVQTFTFAAFGTYTLIMAFAVRNLRRNIFSYPLFSNKYLTVGIAAGIALTAAAIYIPALQTLFGTVPLPLPWVLGVLLVGVFNLALIEAAKKFFRA
jgi:Ca2+-transporting ATPase